MFAKLHSKLGDFWWYSIILFYACRLADGFNAFIGLLLVPKYIGTEELGAVLPLLSFAAFISMPANVFAMVFMKEIISLATHGEYGKMKSLMRGVFVGTGVLLLIAIVVSHFIFPLFLQRIRIEKGSLGILILTSAFCSAVAPIYSNALHALKRFNAVALINVVSAPFRFLTMIIAIPFRALSGYFVGQIAQPTLMIVSSIFCLRKELSVPSEPFWNKTILHRIAIFFTFLMLYNISGGILGLIEQTVLRQHLPEIDSAAYYMATRFSEIAGLIGATFMTIMFPFTAEISAQGRSTRPLVIKSSLATIATSTVLALIFIAAGKPILSILPNGEHYSQFTWAIPWLIGISALSYIPSFHINTEVSAGRFHFLKWWIPLHIIYTSVIVLITEQEYFSKYLPESWSMFVSFFKLTSLEAMLWWFTVTTFIKTGLAVFEFFRQNTNTKHCKTSHA